MKVYNETWLQNRYAIELAKRLQEEAILNSEQLESIKKLHAAIPYSPNIFIKVLLFIFGCIGFGFGGSFFAIFLFGDTKWGLPLCSVFYGGITLFGLIHLIRQRKLYFSGIDNALLYCVLGSLMPLFMKISEINNFKEPWQLGTLYLPFLLLAVYSFGEPLVALGLLFDFLFIISSLLVKHPLGKTLLPFILAGVAAILFFLLHRFSKRRTAFYWHTALEWVSPVVLFVAYLTINYGFVREANASLNNLPSSAPQISFAGLFWGLTAIVPVILLWLGIFLRNRSTLVVALLAGLCSVLTHRYYYGFLPLEWGLLLGGLALASIAYALLRSLKTPKLGFSVAPETTKNTLLQTVVLSQLTKTPNPTVSQEVKMGGGDFGGGGAGDQY
jgi:hypothetical protein